MNKILNFFKQKYVLWGLGAALLVFGGIFVWARGNGEKETLTIERQDFESVVSVSGSVETASNADLGFASSGRIGRVFIKESDQVREGQILAQLEIGDLLADLKIKEINSKTSDVDLEDARENLEKVTAEENVKVESAYRALLSEDLELVADSDNYTVDAPEISGIYDGAEGQYKIRILKENITLFDILILTFDLERTKRLINEEGPTPLGSHGLYISFPDELDDYEDTDWFLDIPNKAGDSYLANYNAWSEAKKARDLAIKNADYEYQKLLSEKPEGQASAAQAEIDKIKSEIRKSTIYAPFEGIITKVEREIGETASANETVVSIMGSGIYQIESYVPEVNIAQIKIGDEAEVTLDAYGENALFQAKVVAIDPAETMRDGVATYKVTLQFAEPDSRIKPGMTANVAIIIFERPGAIIVPGDVIFTQDSKSFVQIKDKGRVVNREVTTGAISSLGQVEIVSGLEEGEEVILNPE